MTRFTCQFTCAVFVSSARPSWLYIRTISKASDVDQLQRSFALLVRTLGLARPDTTPCGVPMSITEAHAISALDDEGPLTQQQLVSGLRLQKSTVSRLVDELETVELVRRKPNPADGRSVLIELTGKGRRRAGRLREARAELFGRLTAELSVADRRQVVAALRTLEEAARALG
jgi:DNA-binding MarR family transcriptional regulator